MNKKELAYTTYVVVICVWFTILIFRSQKYGRDLTRLKTIANQVISSIKTDDVDKIIKDYDNIHIVVLNKQGVIDNISSDIIEPFQVRRLAQSIDDDKISFEHIPDTEGLSHIIAVCKMTSNEWTVIAFMNT